MTNGIVSFRHLRQAAEAIKHVSFGQEDYSKISNSFSKGLLAELRGDKKGSNSARVELKWAVLEFQRIAEQDLDLDATFDSIVVEIDKGHSNLLKDVIFAEYQEEQVFTGLVDWIIQLVGSRASRTMAEYNSKDKRDGKAKVREIHQCISSFAIILDCLCRLSQEWDTFLSPSYFQVVALDSYVKANKAAKDMIASCCRFNTILSLSTKLELFFHDVEIRQRRQEREQMYAEMYTGSSYPLRTKQRQLEVDRQDVVGSSSRELAGMHRIDNLFNNVQIKFLGEEGQDAGGLIKEWLLILCEQLRSKLFHYSEAEAARMELISSCSSFEAELFGTMIGLSILHRIALDISLPHYVLQHLLHQHPSNTLEDLAEIRPGLAKGLSEILLWNEQDFSEKLSINFTYQSVQDGLVSLIPNGSNTPVTFSNRALYVQHICKYILEEQSQIQSSALCQGFQRVCQDLTSLQLFTLDELNDLICGQDISLDVASLRKVCAIDTTTLRNDGYIEQFWNVFEVANDPALLKRLLHFITANHRISPTAINKTAFQVVILHGSEFSNRLPTASTCTNTLFLPKYSSTEELRKRLFTALHHGSVGFGLK